MLGGGGETDSSKLKKDYEAAKLENERLKQQIKQVKEEVAFLLPRSKRRTTSDPSHLIYDYIHKNSIFISRTPGGLASPRAPFRYVIL